MNAQRSSPDATRRRPGRRRSRGESRPDPPRRGRDSRTPALHLPESDCVGSRSGRRRPRRLANVCTSQRPGRAHLRWFSAVAAPSDSPRHPAALGLRWCGPRPPPCVAIFIEDAFGATESRVGRGARRGDRPQAQRRDRWRHPWGRAAQDGPQTDVILGVGPPLPRRSSPRVSLSDLIRSRRG